MDSTLADFIEENAEMVVEQAIAFARTVDVGRPLDEATLRDHLPQIIETVVQDLRTPQTRAQEIEKSEGRTQGGPDQAMSAAGTHALHRARSGYSIADLVAEYRALRASVLRGWADAPDRFARSTAEIARFNEAIDEAIADSVSHYASETERWRNLFLGVLGHDLRSPLTAILITSEMIGRMAAGEPIARAAQRLLRSGEHMRDLLDKLLVYNRTQMGIGFEIRREQTDLADDCAEEIELLRDSMPLARIRYQADGPVRGLFDASRVREALANLVVNAHKYGTADCTIDVELRTRGDDAQLAVRNPGAPIPPETLERLFEPLKRGGVAACDQAERASLGLGLFIVSEIAKAHGGSIQADSRDGSTTFHLQLPRA
ncbi:sensor histidine kinase [Luteimonas sp. M1R5S18]|uniref:histidine kinase n=1 Tax=Luteimonas rhizosphaericola TaxID=3042024 RepID=A0ABT6JHT5_9GAMM|nr:sensor histidine kinase [Luteimonas rhizosphaericola]MDH5830189.1 sensor histidine kinase [Luteimonas rhizosphaericola]